MDKVVSTSLLVEMLCKKNSTRALAEKCFITQESDLLEQNHVDDAKQESKNVGGRPRCGAYEITQKEAAKMLGISEKKLRNWEKGKGMPNGYPGRTNIFAFRQFADSYKLDQSQKAYAKQIDRAPSGGYTGDEVSAEKDGIW